MSIPRQGRPTVLGFLRDDARNWWAHSTRADVNRSVRGAVEHFREALASGGLITLGRGGASMHGRGPDGNQWTLSGFPCDGPFAFEVMAARRLGLPIIDTRTIPDELIVRWACSGPMPGCRTSRFARGSSEPFGALDVLSVADGYGALAASFGATVENCPDVPVPPASVSEMACAAPGRGEGRGE